MGTLILWGLYLLISIITIIFALVYIIRSKSFSSLFKIMVLILCPFVIFVGYQQYTLYKKQKATLPLREVKDKEKIKLVVPLEAQPLIRQYLESIDRDSRPVIIAIPLVLQVRFTDPISPMSPHGICYILFKNEGKLKAVDIDIKWEIIDNGNKITPPDEWNKIIGRKEEFYVLNPNQYMSYLYGPEIGACACTSPPNIELTLRVNYKDEAGREYSYYCKSKSNPKPKPKDTYIFDILDVK